MTEILVALIVLMIIGALVAIETSNLLHSVISISAVGFLLSIVFLFLAAPDLAITQMAVEVITLVILLRVTSAERSQSRQDFGSPNSDEFGYGFFGIRIVAVAMMLILAFFSMQMFADFPEFGWPVMDRFEDAPSNTYLSEGLDETGAANIVTAVLLDFRAYDTLGEATVLFCAVVGALSILRRKAKKKPDEPDEVKER